jgi:hypothetical protein
MRGHTIVVDNNIDPMLIFDAKMPWDPVDDLPNYGTAATSEHTGNNHLVYTNAHLINWHVLPYRSFTWVIHGYDGSMDDNSYHYTLHARWDRTTKVSYTLTNNNMYYILTLKLPLDPLVVLYDNFGYIQVAREDH